MCVKPAACNNAALGLQSSKFSDRSSQMQRHPLVATNARLICWWLATCWNSIYCCFCSKWLLQQVVVVVIVNDVCAKLCFLCMYTLCYADVSKLWQTDNGGQTQVDARTGISWVAATAAPPINANWNIYWQTIKIYTHTPILRHIHTYTYT